MSGSQAPPFLLHFNADNISSSIAHPCNDTLIQPHCGNLQSPQFSHFQNYLLKHSIHQPQLPALPDCLFKHFHKHFSCFCLIEIFNSLISHLSHYPSLPPFFTSFCIQHRLHIFIIVLPDWNSASWRSPTVVACTSSWAREHCWDELHNQLGMTVLWLCKHCLNFKCHFCIHLIVLLSAITS